jgi:hypothetical protein
VKIVSGGTKKRKSAFGRDDYAAEWFVVSAAKSQIRSKQVEDRIETVVKDDDGAESTRFIIGSLQRARGNTSEARRISFVRGLDALIAVGGGSGTRQELALAIEFETRVLPVPGFGGAADEVWRAYRSELIDLLRIDGATARRWEEMVEGPILESQSLADDMVEALLSSLPRRCFVIMPFREDFDELYESIIQPAIEGVGHIPVRVDRAGVPGSVTTQIENGLRACDYAIAVLDYLRPNVLYELGAAHAHGKPAILLNRRGGLGSEQVPFDIYTQQRLEYTDLDAKLLESLTRMLRAVSTSQAMRRLENAQGHSL